MRVGHAFLKEEFDVTPKVGWLVDTFGHSATNARLLAEMGMDAFFFGRVDFKERQYRNNKTEMEFLWYPEFEGPYGPKNSRTALFTHILYTIYQAPLDLALQSPYNVW